MKKLLITLFLLLMFAIPQARSDTIIYGGFIPTISSSTNNGLLCWSGTFGNTVKDCSGTPIFDASGNLVVSGLRDTGLIASQPVETNSDKVLTSGTKTGTGSEYVMSASPTLTGTTNVIDVSGSTLRTTGATGFIVIQDGHSFSVGNVLRHNGTIYVTAQADSASNAEVVGIVSSVIDANNFVLTTGGKVTGLSGLTAGTTYFLSTSSAGALTADDASMSLQISKPLLNADSTTSGYFANMRGISVLAGTTIVPVITMTVSGNITTTQASAGSYIILDSSAWATLPTGVTGMNMVFDNSGNTVVCVDVSGSTEAIVLNGVALTAGNKVCSPALSPGSSISMIYIGSNKWRIPGNSSVWTDGS